MIVNQISKGEITLKQYTFYKTIIHWSPIYKNNIYIHIKQSSWKIITMCKKWCRKKLPQPSKLNCKVLKRYTPKQKVKRSLILIVSSEKMLDIKTVRYNVRLTQYDREVGTYLIHSGEYNEKKVYMSHLAYRNKEIKR